LNSGSLSAEVDPLGAQLSTLRDRRGRDLLWNGDPSVWAGRAPLLFPIVGALAGGTYRLGTHTYRLARHGFARGMYFSIINTEAASAAFRLKADAATLELYPFRFELDVTYSIEGATLSITASVRNTGDEAMPASFGYHTAFRWPLPFDRPRASHVMDFPHDEQAPVRRLDSAGLLTSALHPTPVSQGRLTLADALFERDVIIFDALESRSLIYGTEGAPRLKVTFADAPYLGIWTKPQAPFICIEPWHGVADPEGFAGDFHDKPGVFIVAPGDSLPITMTITVLEAE